MDTTAASPHTTQGGPSARISPVAFHAPDGRAYIGLRSRRDGTLEIVHDRIGVRRSIWQIMSGNVAVDGLRAACQRAVNADGGMGALHDALLAAGVRIECIEDRF